MSHIAISLDQDQLLLTRLYKNLVKVYAAEFMLMAPTTPEKLDIYVLLVLVKDKIKWFEKSVAQWIQCWPAYLAVRCSIPNG